MKVLRKNHHLSCRGKLPISVGLLSLCLGFADNCWAYLEFTGGGNVQEGDSGATTLNFSVNETAILDVPIPFTYRTVGIQATGGVDYEEISGSGVIATGVPEHVLSWDARVDVGGICDRRTAVVDIAYGGGNIFVLAQSSVSKYDLNGQYVGQYGAPCGVFTSFFNPSWITIDQSGRGHIGDRAESSDPFEVEVYWTNSSTFSTVYGRRFDAYDDAYDAAAAPDGTILLCGAYPGLQEYWVEQWRANADDTWSRIRLFESSHEMVRIAVASDGVVHVVGNGQILNLTPIPGSFQVDSSFSIPSGNSDLAIDGSDILYVKHTNSIGRYTRTGVAAGEFAQGFSGRSLTIDYADNIYLGEVGSYNGSEWLGRVHKFSPTFSTGYSFSLALFGDEDPEVNETFTIVYTFGSGPSQYTRTQLVTIMDDDPGVFVSGATIAEGNSGTRQMNFQIGVSTPITNTVTVDYTTADGSATVADNDYAVTAGTLSFLPNGSAAPEPQVVQVAISGDTQSEGDESLRLQLTNVVGAAGSGSEGIGTIADDETSFAFGDATLSEGNAGSTLLKIPVTAVTPFYSSVQIEYATADGTAKSFDQDYAPTSGTILFSPIDPRYSSEINLYNGSYNWRPHSVAVDRSGMLVLTEVQGGVKTYTRDGQEGIVFGRDAGLPGYVNTGQMVAVDSQDFIYVADLSNGIIKFDRDGNFVSTFGGFPAYARAIAIDAADIVYVVDWSGFKIDKYTSGGTHLGQWGSRGSGPGQMEWPVGITVDANQAVYVSDEVLNRITKFAADGTLLDMWGSAGTGPGQFDKPYGMAVDSKGRIHVADEGNGRIQVFSPDGDYITEWNPIALGGTLDKPYDLDFDAEGVAWVVARAKNILGAYVVESFDLDLIVPDIEVSVNGDVIFEDDETFSVEVTGVIGDIAVLNSTGLVTILNDDDPLGAVTYVDRSNPNPGDGSSWTASFNDLAQALAAAAASPDANEIWVADGLYHPTPGTDRDATFALSDGLYLYGGFAGNETMRSERDPSANLTILSGDIGAPEEPGDNSYHVVSCVAEADSIPLFATIDGFVITGANSLGQPDTSRGGGIRVHYGTLAGRNIQLVDNQAQYGAGIANQYGTVLLENVEIRGNSAVRGGGMNGRFSSSTLINVVVEGNSADFYGGIGLIASDLDLVHTTIANNSANTVIGGLSAEINSVVTNHNSILWGNTAPSIPNLYITSGSTVTSAHSLVEGSGGSSEWNGSFGSDAGGNLDEDPMFVNTLVGDLRLQSGSPGIDSGDDSLPGLPTTDLAGNARKWGASVDQGAYEYVDPATGVEDEPTSVLARSTMSSPYPNPFNPRATVKFSLAQPDRASIRIFDTRGRLVRTLVDEEMTAGEHIRIWEGRDDRGQGVASGVYLVEFRAKEVYEVRRATLVK